MWADLVGISLSHTSHQAFYIPVGHRHQEATNQLPLSWVLEQLKPILEDGQVRKVGQNIKYEWIVLKQYGIDLQGIQCDTMLASYVLNPTKHNHNLGEIAREVLDRNVTEYKEVVGTGSKAVTFDQIDLEKARDYSCEDADVTLQLSHLLLPKLEEEGFQDLYEQVEIPLVVVLAKDGDERGKDRRRSPPVDCLKRWKVSFNRRWSESIRLAGEVFNINSSATTGKNPFRQIKAACGQEDQDRLLHRRGCSDQTLSST